MLSKYSIFSAPPRLFFSSSPRRHRSGQVPLDFAGNRYICICKPIIL
nr:MAG TPA: hypothetical protein [Caudoviricetes sp.]